MKIKIIGFILLFYGCSLSKGIDIYNLQRKKVEINSAISQLKSKENYISYKISDLKLKGENRNIIDEFILDRYLKKSYKLIDEIEKKKKCVESIELSIKELRLGKTAWNLFCFDNIIVPMLNYKKNFDLDFILLIKKKIFIPDSKEKLPYKYIESFISQKNDLSDLFNNKSLRLIGLNEYIDDRILFLDRLIRINKIILELLRKRQDNVYDNIYIDVKDQNRELSIEKNTLIKFKDFFYSTQYFSKLN